MSLTRSCTWLAALIAVLAVSGLAHAQHVHPFIEPGAFGPDLQFFAPAEIDDYGGIDPPKHGWFFTYDRLNVYVSRPNDPESFGSGHDGDFTWGNLVDAGFMAEDDAGWLMSTTHITGPNEYFVTPQERSNRINTDDEIGLGTGTGTEDILIDRNPRIYNLSQSLNVMRYTSFEFSRVWRRKQFHNGAVLEPFLGVRYMNFKDYGRRDAYQRVDVDANDDPDFALPIFSGRWEILDSALSVFENQMLGGQLGFRFHNQYGAWNLSTELRMFALQNWQSLSLEDRRTLTRYDSVAEDSTVETNIEQRTLATVRASEFVWGGELRGKAAYTVTRDISLDVGFTLTDLGRGIGRGRSIARNSQDVQMGGVMFGVVINR